MKLPKRFIIIDDDAFNNILCKNILNKLYPEIEVIDFTAPEDGIAYIELEYVKNPVPTVVFLDINMPTLTGWEVLDKIEEYPENLKTNLKVYILSSSIDLHDKKKASENPLVSGYVEKPLMVNKVESLFNSNP